jgi:hypothetical protein
VRAELRPVLTIRLLISSGVLPLPDRVRPQHSAASMGQQSNKVEKKKRRLAYLERKKERVKKAIVGAKKASRK